MDNKKTGGNTVTYEEKKEYLSQYVNEKRNIDSFIRDLEYWETIGESMAAGDGSGSGKSSCSKVETAATHIAMIKADIEKDIIMSKQKREEVRNAVERLRTSKYKTVLIDVYIAGKSRTDVANERGVSVKKINGMIRRALEQLDI